MRRLFGNSRQFGCVAEMRSPGAAGVAVATDLAESCLRLPWFGTERTLRTTPLPPSPSTLLETSCARSQSEHDSVMTFTRITVDAERMGGLPCVRDLRFPVASVVAMVADRMTVDEILAEHPDLEAEDVAECLRYAALAVQERELPLRQPA